MSRIMAVKHTGKLKRMIRNSKAKLKLVPFAPLKDYSLLYHHLHLQQFVVCTVLTSSIPVSKGYVICTGVLHVDNQKNYPHVWMQSDAAGVNGFHSENVIQCTEVNSKSSITNNVVSDSRVWLIQPIAIIMIDPFINHLYQLWVKLRDKLWDTLWDRSQSQLRGELHPDQDSNLSNRQTTS